MKRRVFGAVILLGSSTVSYAQVLAFGPSVGMLRTLQERKLVPTADPGNPLQPTGFAQESKPEVGKVPEPEVDDKSFQILRAGKSRQIGNDVSMTGGTEFMYKGYHVFADSAEGSLTSHIFSLKGDVKVIGKDALVAGDRVTIDFDQKLYHAVNSKQDLKPSLVQGQFREDLYTHGADSYGSANEQQTMFGGITSCDLLHPHYEIDADNIIIRPRKRAIFRKARVKLFGRTIVKIPYLSIPLDDHAYQNMPVIGRSTQEGYYIKFRYAFPLKGDNEVRTHFDYMTELGLGIGADYLYKNRVMNGVLQVYTIAGPGEMLKVNDEHRQQFKWGTLAVTTDYEKNNYLVAPGSTVESTQALLTFPQRGGTVTKLTLQQSGNSTGVYSSSNESVSLADTRKFTDKITTTTNLDYQQNATTYQGPTGAVTQTNQSMNVKLDVQDDLKQALADLTYQRNIPIGSTQAVFGANDQTPVVTLSSDSRRLLGSTLSQNWPFKTSLSIGEFTDQIGGGQITRDAFDFGFQHPDRSTGRFHSDITGEFKQGVYSDGTAQYVLNLSDIESYRVGSTTSVNLRYNYLRPYGYSPLSIDQTGRTNLATIDFSVKPIKTLSVGAQSGYDITRLQQQEAPWQPLGVRVEYQPKNYFMLRAQSTYDTFQGAWSNVRVDISYKPGATFLSVGSYYDGIRHTWSNVNLFLDGLKVGRMKLGAILSYNGFTQQFDSQQYSCIYDLHCAEAVFTMTQQQTGFNPGNTYALFIRLKALPFDSLFGAGSRGQPLGTGTGTSY